MSGLANTLRIISQFTGSAFRTFALTLILIDVLYGFVMVAIAYGVASDGSLIRGILASFVVISLVMTVGLLLSFQSAVLNVVRKAIQDHQIGRKIFDTLFDKALKSTPFSESKLTSKEVERIFNKAAKNLLHEKFSAADAPGVALWLAKQIQRVTVWATVKVIVKSCSPDGDFVKLEDVRDRLAAVIDQTLLLYLKEHYRRIFFAALGITTSLSILICMGIRQLPI
ncbi:hypothetical protein V2O64_21970 [Verrucomicrobiaceae bacterium 227]